MWSYTIWEANLFPRPAIQCATIGVPRGSAISDSAGFLLILPADVELVTPSCPGSETFPGQSYSLSNEEFPAAQSAECIWHPLHKLSVVVA